MNLTIPNGVEHGLGTGIVRPLQSLCDNCRFQVVAALYERRSYSKIKTGGHRPPLQPQFSHRHYQPFHRTLARSRSLQGKKPREISPLSGFYRDRGFALSERALVFLNPGQRGSPLPGAPGYPLCSFSLVDRTSKA